MAYATRLVRWNQWYDQLPDEWRFQLILWPLIVVGAVNLMLTIWSGFPFALLVVLGIFFITAVRVPYVLGWTESAPAGDKTSRFQIHGAPWVVNINRRYDALPEARRFWVFPAVLLIAGAINMMLTIDSGFPFGLLFLLALLALVVIRAPFAAGWIAEPVPEVGPNPESSQEVPHVPVQALSNDPEPTSNEPPLSDVAARPDSDQPDQDDTKQV